MSCRICLDNIEIGKAVSDLCKCKEVYFHKKCAIKWFCPRIQGVSQGKITEDRRAWNTQWCARCEVCNSNIDSEFIKMCVLELKRETFHNLRNIVNYRTGSLESTNNSIQISTRNWNFFGCFS